MKNKNIRMMKKNQEKLIEDTAVEKNTVVNYGVIEDPANIFKLAMLERDLEKLQLQHQLYMKHIDEQSTALLIKKNQLISQFKLNFKQLKERHAAHKEYIEKKYNIGLSAYVYDDELGTLKRKEELADNPIKKEG